MNQTITPEIRERIRGASARLHAFLKADEEQDPYITFAAMQSITLWMFGALAQNRDHFIEGLDLFKAEGLKRWDTLGPLTVTVPPEAHGTH